MKTYVMYSDEATIRANTLPELARHARTLIIGWMRLRGIDEEVPEGHAIGGLLNWYEATFDGTSGMPEWVWFVEDNTKETSE